MSKAEERVSKKYPKNQYFMTDEFKSKVALESQKYTTSEETDIFEEGVVFGLNAVWHEASEEPKEGKRLLYEFAPSYSDYILQEVGYYEKSMGKFGNVYTIERSNVKRWCYLEDLL